MTRTVNDWGALCLAEIKNHEPSGTVARLIAEACGRKPPTDDEAGDRLLKLAEAVSAPPALKVRLAEFTKETATQRAAIAKERADSIAELDRLKREQEKNLQGEHAALQ